MKRVNCLFAVGALVLAGCSPHTDTPPPSVAVETETRADLTPALRRLAAERGKAIAAETFSLLSSNLQSALGSGGVSNALPYCSLTASPLTTAVAERHGVRLRRVTQKPRNPTGRADAIETAFLERYRGALSSGNRLEPVVTNLQPGQVTFFAPIVLTDALCLKCHGQPGTDIASEDLALIRRLYPRDEAVGFSMGELRGAWRIDFPISKLEAQPRVN